MKKKKSLVTIAFICFFTFLSTLLSLVIRINDRKQIIKAIGNDEGVVTLLESRKETNIM